MCALRSERLLRHERVRSNRTGVDLVSDKVAKLQHVDVADHDLLVERFAGAAVVQARFAITLHPGVNPSIFLVGLVDHFLDFLFLVTPSKTGDAIFNPSAFAATPRWVSQHLTNVHTAGDAERI